MTDRPLLPPDDRKPVAVTMPLPPAATRLVAQQLRRAAELARTHGDLVRAEKLQARADALCPAPPAGWRGPRT